MRINTQTARANETVEEKAERLQRKRINAQTARANETVEEKADRLARDRTNRQMARRKQKTSVEYKDAMKSQAILDGTFPVAPLHITPDNIGQMSVECSDCGALKYPGESPGMCCSSGKVVLEPFPRPPELILRLFMSSSDESQIFRKNSRSINNAVCLTSIKNNTPTQEGWRPSVIFQGQVQTRMGPLLPAEGEQPRFAQLYVHDAALESTSRFNNLILPSNTSEEDKTILRSILDTVQWCLHDSNPFVQDFIQIMDIPEDELANGMLVISAKQPSNEHARRYNIQTNLKEVSILMNSEKHDLVLQMRGGGLQTVNNLNPKMMPLHFCLLFPYGTYGWDPETRHSDGKRRTTTREFYNFHLQIRSDLPNENYIHMGGRLFQEWLCMAWVATEDNRLNFQRANQKALRADTYKSLKDAVEEHQRELAPREDGVYEDDHQRPRTGRKILSSSFSSSPRWYNAKFQDGMAICREYHKPDYFITMTCNPLWPEIQNALLPGQSTQDRPDVVARVFKQKKDQLMKDLIVGGLFGRVSAHLHVIEFQKRGLPHAHILLILADYDRTPTQDLVDSLISAELPPDPDAAEDPEAKCERKRMEDLVLSCMVHGPCGANNPRAPCMEDGHCTKKFPKPFQSETVVDPEQYYATYQRRSPEDGGRIVKNDKGREIDNGWIIPYNPYLSLRFECHINVECCASPKAAKYLYKYVTKGNDRAMVATRVEGEQQERDEIKEYQDLRSVGSSEAAWHLLAFPITERHPAVLAMRIHLKEEQQVIFDMDTEAEALERQRNTELTAFFDYNQKNNGEDRLSMPTYVDMPKSCVYDKSKKEWRKRKNQGETTIGRVHSVNPVAGDVYYLRMLLHNDHCRGKVSFEDMLTLEDGRVCETYKEVCFQLGLLQDNSEWEKLLEEAAATKMCPQIRELYVIILMFCMPSNPRALFDEFWSTWVDDYEQKQRRSNGSELTETQKKTLLLLDLESRLDSFEKQLKDFGLPTPTQEELATVNTITSLEPAVIREELDFDTVELNEMVAERQPGFTPEQNTIFETVMKAVNGNEELQIFIDARGGCGKTFLLNTILAAVRGQGAGSTALAMATTGIAANLLSLGRTFHSRLKAPLDATDESTLQITAQSALAKLVRECKLMMIDEATMLSRQLLEALDRTLRDLMNSQHPFGGKIIILAGDFRQCLPVVPGASRPQIVRHCINQSSLWSKFQVMRLSVNMRVMAGGDASLIEFDQWGLGIGNGEVENVEISKDQVSTIIKKNSKDNPTSEGQAMREFIQKVFPSLATNIADPKWMEGRSILAATNKEVDMINNLMEEMIPGNTDKLAGADSLENPDDILRFNTEYLNSLVPTGFPVHTLRLKKGMPLMLLRNLNPREGLCNGTKMIYEKCHDYKVLECKLVGTMRTVLIPRITLIPKAGMYPFEWKRRQFPVRPAFATTINKSQGQTLKTCGLWLRRPAFTHGQLYVACSRVGKPSNLLFALNENKDDQRSTMKNVVFKEVLLSE